MSDRTIHYRTCPLCEAMCGLEIHVEGDAVPLIRADRDDVWSQGFLCPMGTTLGHLHHDPDRLNNNLLAPGHLVDVISGNAAVNGIPVEVVPA